MRNHVALWGGVSAFFATLLGLGIIDLANTSDRYQLLNGVFVGLITGGAVFAKQKWDDAKKGRVSAGSIVVTESDEKDIFTLELDKAPEDLKDKEEVVFKVHRV